jgi:hypothetical protein
MVQSVASLLGLGEGPEWRPANFHGSVATSLRSPRRNVSEIAMKAGAGGAFMSDDKGELVSRRAPHSHINASTMELEWHRIIFPLLCSMRH